MQVKAAPLPQAPNDSDLEVSDEDIDFVDEYSQRLGFLTSLNREQIDRYTISPAQALLTHRHASPSYSLEAAT